MLPAHWSNIEALLTRFGLLCHKNNNKQRHETQLILWNDKAHVADRRHKWRKTETCHSFKMIWKSNDEIQEVKWYLKAFGRTPSENCWNYKMKASIFTKDHWDLKQYKLRRCFGYCCNLLMIQLYEPFGGDHVDYLPMAPGWLISTITDFEIWWLSSGFATNRFGAVWFQG